MIQAIHVVQGILILQTFHACASRSNTLLKGSVELLDKESRRLKRESIECSLSSVSLRLIEHYRLIGRCDKVLPCLINYLEDKKTDASAWCNLAECYKQLKLDSNLVNKSFKQASQLHGEVTEYIRQWHFIGPFGIGKIELDGDPLEFFGGIQEVAKKRFKKGEKFYSEIYPGGEVAWTILKQKSRKEKIQISPAIQWNDLINSLGSLAIYEWQGWVVGEFVVNDENLILVFQCLGVHTFYIDDRPITGDVYHRDVYWFSAALEKGIHTLYVQLRTKAQGVFQCNIKQVLSEIDIAGPIIVPDLVDGYVFSDLISIPIMNLSPNKWLSIMKVSIESQSQGDTIKLSLYGSSKYFSLAPGQVSPIHIRFSSYSERIVNTCSDLFLTLALITSVGEKQVPLTLRCRKTDQSFIFTFLDHDGSVQHAAAIHPSADCGATCPVLLTLHGTSVPAQNQADSYKYMKNGNYIFGLDEAWILAPTRHGAHNWEGPGALSALEALQYLATTTSSHTWIQNKASTENVIFAGHSMGGHGAWHLGTHFPDKALGLISLAGWIKKEEYGDSNLFFKHDIATSHTDPAIKAVLEACISENDADRHVSNIQDIPVFMRIGADDRTVHPYFMRRMYRILKEQNVNVTYSELAGKEHWWWDTWKTNDGGAVNDPILRDFTLGILRQNKEVDNQKSNKYSKGTNERKSFTLTVMNPAFGGSLYGLQILLQHTPYRTSRVEGSLQAHEAVLKTTNVKRFSVGAESVRPVLWSPLSIEIDGQRVERKDPEGENEFCFKSGKWSLCRKDDPNERRLETLGPARRIAEKPFVIVIGTKGTDAMKTAIFESAEYIANLFFLTSEASAPILKDADMTDEIKASHNLILLGGPEENLQTKEYLSKVPLKLNKGFQLGRCLFSDQHSGALFLAPHADSNLAMVMMGLSLKGFRDVVTLATPTIPPMTRSPFSNLVPDFAITGPEFKAKGPGGYSCIGFWGNRWELRPDLISCSC